MAENKASLLEDLEKIPCFKQTFTFSICCGIGAGLATFLFTSRIKRSSDVAVLTFSVTTLAKWFHCRYNWSKESKMSKKMQDALHDVMLKEGTKPPAKEKITTL